MQQVYVVHYHEIALKGRNRPMFLRALQENICRATGLGKGSVKIVSGRLIVFLTNYEQSANIRTGLQRTFGISSFSPAVLIKAECAEIEKAIVERIKNYELRIKDDWRTFSIAATRGDKKFPLTSKEIEIKLGDFVREKFKKKVKLESPDITFYVEIFSGGAVVYTEKISGSGGLPVGIAGKVAVLLSGGIDSPVAAYRIMKRGAPIVAVHFHSYPFASRASIDKVKEVVQILESYSGGRSIPLHVVPLAEAQKQVVQNCAERYRVLLYRRLMWRIAEQIARKAGARALVTGEALGQVASQTIENMAAVEAVITLPIFRPLIGYDKQEIIDEAMHIGTYDISILPHDDCCTLFMPKQVVTKARAVDLNKEEGKLDILKLVDVAIAKTE